MRYRKRPFKAFLSFLVSLHCLSFGLGAWLPVLNWVMVDSVSFNSMSMPMRDRADHAPVELVDDLRPAPGSELPVGLGVVDGKGSVVADAGTLEYGRKLDGGNGVDEDSGELAEDGRKPDGGVGPTKEPEDCCKFEKDLKLDDDGPELEDDLEFEKGPTTSSSAWKGDGSRLC